MVLLGQFLLDLYTRKRKELKLWVMNTIYMIQNWLFFFKNNKVSKQRFKVLIQLSYITRLGHRCNLTNEFLVLNLAISYSLFCFMFLKQKHQHKTFCVWYHHQ
jgi:hypothetical protein